MFLVHDGKLKYDDHLTDVFPEFPVTGIPSRFSRSPQPQSGLPDYEDILMKQYPGTPETNLPRFSTLASSKLLEQQTAGKCCRTG